MAQLTPGKQAQFVQEILTKKKPSLLIVDVEGTGLLKPKNLSDAKFKPVVLQIGGVHVKGGKAHPFSWYIDPYAQGVPLPGGKTEAANKAYLKYAAAAEEIHHIKILPPDQYQKGELVSPQFARQELEKMFGPKTMLATYGNAYDTGMLEGIGFYVPPEKKILAIDVLAMVRQSGVKVKSKTLGSVTNYLGYEKSKYYNGAALHDALEDAQRVLFLMRDKRINRSSMFQALRHIYGDPNKAISVMQQAEYIKQNNDVRNARRLRGEPASGKYEAKRQDKVNWEAGGSTRTIRVTEGATSTKKGRSLAKEPDVTLGYTSWDKVNASDAARIRRDEDRYRSSSIVEGRDYLRQREFEEAIFKGEHSPEVLAMANRRIPFWRQVNPLNMRREFLQGKLGFSEEDIDILKGVEGAGEGAGRGRKTMLRKEFAQKMAEFELTGHLSRSEYLGQAPSTGATTRIVSFGELPRDPGALFSGLLPSRKSAYILPSQQVSLADVAFGVKKEYRIASTGELITPKQLSKLYLTQEASKLDTKDKLKEYLQGRVKEERKLYRLEKQGKITRIEPVDAYTAVGRSKETPPPFTMSGGELNEKMVEAIEGSTPDAKIHLAEESGIDLRTEAGKVAAEKEAERITGMATEAPSLETSMPMQGSAYVEEINRIDASKDISAEELKALQEQMISYRTVDKYHEKLYKKLKNWSNRAFGTQLIETPGTKGRNIYKKIQGKTKMMVQKIRIPGTRAQTAKIFSATAFLNSAWDQAIASLSQEQDLSKLAPSEVEKRLESAFEQGYRVFTKGGKGSLQEVVSSDLKNMGNVLLQDTANKSAKYFSSLQNEIPVEAQAEQVLDIYFRKEKGRKGVRPTRYGAYTAEGTFLGKVSGKVTPPWKAAGKIFEYGGRYNVVWQPTADPFYKSRFGEIEVADAADRAKKGLPPVNYDISSPLDVKSSYVLGPGGVDPEELKRIYEQSGGDYGLISRFRPYREGESQIDPKTGKPVKGFLDTKTGKPATQEEMTAYYAAQEKLYSRHWRAQQRYDIKKTKTVDLTAKAAGENAAASAARKLTIDIPKGRSLLFGAIGLSAALVSLTAFSSRKQVRAPEDVHREQYGSTRDDERMFSGRPQDQQVARVTPEYAGPMGYTTNIDVSTTDRVGVDHQNLSSVMNRHARNTLGNSRGNVNVEINDNSDRASSYELQRRYSNMLRT